MSQVRNKFRLFFKNLIENLTKKLPAITDTNIVTPQKRHKKHKHKRHKKKKLSHDEEDLGYDKGIGAGEMERSKKNSKVRGKKLEDIKG